MDKEFLQYIKDTGYNDLSDINDKDIIKYKNTLDYQNWLLWQALEKLAKAILETKIGSAIIWIAEFLGKCILLNFKRRNNESKRRL